VALVMALGRGVLGPEQEPSVYETRGVLVFGGADDGADDF